MPPTRPAFLIVGAGLAGSWLAHFLGKFGAVVSIADRPLPGASSRVAAGLFHPAPGARWRLRPGFASQREFAAHHYQTLEKTAQQTLWHELPLRRSLADPAARQRWQANRAELGPWILAEHPDHIEFRGAGWVNVPAALAALQRPVRQAGCFHDTVVEDRELLEGLSANAFHWRGQSFAAVVLCRGWREADALGGTDLTWRCARGELLRLRPTQTPSLDPNQIHLERRWAIPLGDGTWRCGATHQWHQLPLGPRRAGVQQILRDLPADLTQNAEIEAAAGVRPIQRADQVLAEPVPGQLRLWRFNSLGSHGALQAPWHAQRLARQLVEALR